MTARLKADDPPAKNRCPMVLLPKPDALKSGIALLDHEGETLPKKNRNGRRACIILFTRSRCPKPRMRSHLIFYVNTIEKNNSKASKVRKDKHY